MRRSIRPAAFVVLLAAAVSGSAQEKGNWLPASSNAASITGAITISDARISINFMGFTIAQIRRLAPEETSAVFASEPTGASGNLYRLKIPARQRFLHKNSLCGSDDVQWMVTSVADRALHLAFFSGPDTPRFTPEAMTNSSDLCGTFTYGR
jgi:hypothetical protein